MSVDNPYGALAVAIGSACTALGLVSWLASALSQFRRV